MKKIYPPWNFCLARASNLVDSLSDQCAFTTLTDWRTNNLSVPVALQIIRAATRLQGNDFDSSDCS